MTPQTNDTGDSLFMKRISFLTHNWLSTTWHNVFLRAIAPRIIGTCYDLGCGKQPYKEFIESLGAKYVGVDWDNSQHGVSPDISANLNEHLPLEDNVADTVLSISVIEHLCEPELFLREVKRILQPNGSLILQVPFQWWVHEAPHDYYRYTNFGLEYLLKKVGFHDIDVVANTGFWSTWILKFNYHSVRYIRGPYPLRLLIRAFLLPIWLVGQTVAPFLDRVDRNEAETASYTVVARKSNL